ncbi:MAG TPA: hypothetical protein VF941_14240 [Clostridia bacterium]
MNFEIPLYKNPDFNRQPFIDSPSAKIETVQFDGVAPYNYHATSIYPEYIKLDGKWMLVQESRMDCVIRVIENTFEVVEIRRLKKNDRVVTGRIDDGSHGIFVYADGFYENGKSSDVFSFRSGRSRETAYSRDYDRLYNLLRQEKENGYVTWVLGPAAAFDFDSRLAMVSLIKKGYVHALLAGNALAVHDIEGAVFKSALGQNIYNQASMPGGHYNHLDIINSARRYSSLKEFIINEKVMDGIIHACVENSVPFVLSGSIRDDGPLPSVLGNVYEAQDEMRRHARSTTTMIGLATQLHSIATGNMMPSYRVINGAVRPVFIYSVDVSEFAVNKLRDRGSLEVTTIVANVQDFLVNLNRNL